jgi:hypothetical protein
MTESMNDKERDTNTLPLRAEWPVGITLTYYIGTIISELLKEAAPGVGLWKYLCLFDNCGDGRSYLVAISF